jgi:opacity protein-like surface antigen
MVKQITRGAVSAMFFLAMLGLCYTTAYAQAEVPKVELGGFFAFTRLRDLDSNASGFGGRVTFNPHPNFGIEAEIGYSPSIGLGGLGDETGDVNVKLKMLTGLFGVKLTGRPGERVAVFGKIRPGFVRFTASANVPGTPASVNASTRQFAIDYGGGVEVFASKRVGFRFDAGDLIIFDVEETRLFRVLRRSHNLNITAGVTFRF